MLLKKIYWRITRCWLHNVRGLSNSQIDSLLALRQFLLYPDRWNKKVIDQKKAFEPSKEEKERWFDEEMLRRPGNDGPKSLEGQREGN